MTTPRPPPHSHSVPETSSDDDSFSFQAVRAIVSESPPPSEIPDPPVAVSSWLYLSPLHVVLNHEKDLHELGITHVVSTNRMPPHVLETLYWQLRSVEIQHLYIQADDQLDYNMMGHWEECCDFLQQAFEEGKALVHCAAGMNRSGTIVAAAMLHFDKMNLLDVARQLKAKRGYVLSNESFLKQLVQFAAQEGRLGTIEPER